jgi:8-oxo-dGTP pyrophosphatase MutT (NUDIX family)
MKNFATPKPEELRRLLSGCGPPSNESTDVPKAAVLILIYGSGENFFIPLTVRSNDLPVHAGQISLPGGRVHSTDSCIEMTALREAKEEVGVQLELSDVIGRLPPITTNSGFEVTPVVAWAHEPPEFNLEPREVSELIALPLELALDVTQYKQDSIVENGLKRDYCYLNFNNFRIWGATARILKSFASLMQ